MTTVKRKSKQLGQILIELGYITSEQLDHALEEHRRTPKSLGRVLIDLGMIKDVRIGDGAVTLTVNLTTPACPLKAQIERDVRTALAITA